MKCDNCLNARRIISENGLHSICCLSEKVAIDCIMGKKDHRVPPKGHGIDADELYDGFIDGTEGYDCQTWNRIEIGDIIEEATTIIEANTESE